MKNTSDSAFILMFLSFMTVHIPDWIFCGPFWAGFGSAILLAVIFIAWSLAKMGPRF